MEALPIDIQCLIWQTFYTKHVIEEFVENLKKNWLERHRPKRIVCLRPGTWRVEYKHAEYIYVMPR